MKTIRYLATIGPLLFAASGSMAGTAPNVATECNSPGWITVRYAHPGDDGAVQYYIERKDAGITFSMAAPTGQVTDANLKPETEYAYRVCAVYEGEDDATCSSFVTQRTMPTPGKPTNFDPPFINNVTIDTGKIAIAWGPTGEYSKVLLRLDDDRGNLGQWDVGAAPRGFGSFTFQPLQPNTNYHIILKGCTWGLFGSSCGPWSQRYTFTTHGPQPPPPPPGKPTLTVSGTTATTVSVAWTVKVFGSYPDDRVILIRDGAAYKQLDARSWLGGLQGEYTDQVTARHTFQVCFERDTFDQRACSARVVDPVMRSRSEAEIVPGIAKKITKRSQALQPDVSVAGASSISGNAIKATGVSAVSPAAFCAAYADEAVASAAENVALNCGGGGGRWTADRNAHVSWCMGLNGDRTVPNAEKAARAAALEACRASQ
jgi:hypothetical protein